MMNQAAEMLKRISDMPTCTCSLVSKHPLQHKKDTGSCTAPIQSTPPSLSLSLSLSLVDVARVKRGEDGQEQGARPLRGKANP